MIIISLADNFLITCKLSVWVAGGLDGIESVVIIVVLETEALEVVLVSLPQPFMYSYMWLRNFYGHHYTALLSIHSDSNVCFVTVDHTCQTFPVLLVHTGCTHVKFKLWSDELLVSS